MVPNTKKRASAGRVLIKPKGDWDSTTTYEMLDLVNHNGYAFLAKRTVVGIEPSDEYPEYWHNLLDMQKIVENSISETVADDVGNILEERFRDILSEARLVTNLNADFTEATFVQWNNKTMNTPATAGLTESAEGFALVFGTVETNRTLIAWTSDGESFISCVKNGVVHEWEKYISSSGGTLTGPLGLGGGKGSVSADDEGAFLEAYKDSENYRKIKVDMPSANDAIAEAIKFISSKNGVESIFNLFGTHNLPKAAQIHTGNYVGTGEDEFVIQSPDFTPKFLLLYTVYTEYREDYGNVSYSILNIYVKPSTVGLSFEDNTVFNHWGITAAPIEWITNSCKVVGEANRADKTYTYVVLG